MSHKRAGILSLRQLTTIAVSDAKLSTSTWKRVAQTFEARPEIVQELAELREHIPQGSSRDLVISAIRRICWQSDRLPTRHRRAIREVGKSPLSFMRLALEEARTASWRTLDAEPLATMSQWIGQLPLKAVDEDASLELAFEASAYHSFCTLRFGEKDAFSPALLLMVDLAKDAWTATPALVEGFLALALFHASIGQWTDSAECLHDAESLLGAGPNSGLGDDLSELRAWLKLCRGWAEGIRKTEQWKMEYLITEALKELDRDSDPWLPLFLHHESAKSIISVGSASLPDLGELLEHGFNRLADSELEQRQASFAWLQAKFFEHSTHERDAILRAQAHLEAADQLFSEFRTDGLAISYLWLQSHTLIHDDPIRGIELIMESLKLAMKSGKSVSAQLIMIDTFYLLCQLGRSTESTERIQLCAGRATQELIEAIHKLSVEVANT